MSVKSKAQPAVSQSARVNVAPRIKPPKRMPNTRDPEKTKAAILDAAVKEFTAKGHHGARVDAIAARAGTNKRMLYHYFGDKDALYVAVLEGAYSKIRSAERALRLADLAPEDAISELVRFTWNYFLENPDFLSLLGSENLHRGKFLKRSGGIPDLNSPLIAVIGEVLKRGARAGRFRSGIDPVDMYITIASLGFFYLSNKWTLSTVFGRDLMHPEALDAWGKHMKDVALSFVTRRS